MKVELKKLKHHKGLSEETRAFSAEVYIDGKHAGYTSNRGHGEANMTRWNHREMGDNFEAWAKSLPPVNFEDTPLPMMGTCSSAPSSRMT